MSDMESNEMHEPTIPRHLVEANARLSRRVYPIAVYLRDRASGDTRVYETTGEDHPDSGNFNDFIWSEGNYSCDCNRCLFLWNWDDSKDLPCNTEEPRIIVDKIVRTDTGATVYTETE
jgi:hypothetical protein